MFQLATLELRMTGQSSCSTRRDNLERKREREREREREKERDRKKEKKREREREIKREPERKFVLLLLRRRQSH
jgi:hypothetical protein